MLVAGGGAVGVGVTVGNDVAVGDGSGVTDTVGSIVGAITSAVAVAVMVGKLGSASWLAVGVAAMVVIGVIQSVTVVGEGRGVALSFALGWDAARCVIGIVLTVLLLGDGGDSNAGLLRVIGAGKDRLSAIGRVMATGVGVMGGRGVPASGIAGNAAVCSPSG